MLQSDVIWANVPMLETALLAGLSQLSGRNIVATHHGDLILPEGGANKFIVDTMFAFYKVMARRAARLIAYSRDYA
jgi:hypothetical protein